MICQAIQAETQAASCKQLFSPPARKPINWKIDCFMFHPSFLSTRSESDGSAEPQSRREQRAKARGSLSPGRLVCFQSIEGNHVLCAFADCPWLLGWHFGPVCSWYLRLVNVELGDGPTLSSHPMSHACVYWTDPYLLAL